ncbi:MAG: penicillin-binding protein 2 [Bacillota bacterium]
MSEGKVPYENRAYTLGILVLCIFVVLIARLWLLQVISGPENYAQASSNSQRRIPLPAPRGLILDRKGKILVSSRLSYIVQVVPKDLTASSQKRLLSLLNITAGQLEEKIRESMSKTEDPESPITIISDLDPVTVLKMEEDKRNLNGVGIQEVYVRYYPYKEYGAHLFGYLGKINKLEWDEKKKQNYRRDDVIGKTGLEKIYEPELKGDDGVIIYEMDAKNRTLGELDRVKPIPGSRIMLTIDWKTQMAAEKALREHLQYLRSIGRPMAKAGTAVAVDPDTGGILAMVSFPSYDPNMFLGRTPSGWYDSMVKNPLDPFMNRAIAAYPPGSVFKPVTALAALEEKEVTLSDRFNCNGYYKFYREIRKCWISSSGGKHGKEDLINGIKNSCNVVFYELGKRVSIERLAKYARLFGLGRKTGLRFSPVEASGIVPDPEYRLKVYRNKPKLARWNPGETLNVAIGQGDVMTTPLQIAQMYMAIANRGKVYRPHLVLSMKDYFGQTFQEYRTELVKTIYIRSENWEILEKGLKGVVSQGGTAGWAFYGVPYQVAGKTGTAQNSTGQDHGWFAGYAGNGASRIVVVVMAESGGSGSAGAAPVARRIMDAFFGVENKPLASRPDEGQNTTTAGLQTPPTDLPESRQQSNTNDGTPRL